MYKTIKKENTWAVIGAGPAGIASVGLLLEQGISPNNILWIDPLFQVGDFGQYWGEVYSNTSVELFMRFLIDIPAFNFKQRPVPFAIESMPADQCCQLKTVTAALQWVTTQLREQVNSTVTHVKKLTIENGFWNIDTNKKKYMVKKVILATGGDPKSLHFDNIRKISLYDALNPIKLPSTVNHEDTVAVFGSSHSSMIIMKNLIDSGVKKIINFYLLPHRYAIKMGNWTLYDNTGLKAHTAQWVRKHISEKLDPRIARYLSTDENIEQHLPDCNKAIYPIGFKARSPKIPGINTESYDADTGIIGPGIFGAGIGYPLMNTNPLGGKEFSVGLYKFMNDIRGVLPIWLQYDL